VAPKQLPPGGLRAPFFLPCERARLAGGSVARALAAGDWLAGDDRRPLRQPHRGAIRKFEMADIGRWPTLAARAGLDDEFRADRETAGQTTDARRHGTLPC